MNYSFWIKPAAMLCLAWAFGVRGAAQSVIFPQERQAGSAVLTQAAGRYTLQNDLFRASFKRQGNSLIFDGCPEMNLEAGSELFELRLGDGSSVVKASEMALVGEVRLKDVAARHPAVKGAHRFSGKALEADFAHGDLRLTWRAVLRNGSHYLRTELELSAPTRDVKMHSITPLAYEVNVQQAGDAPRVVGNTRGAALLSKKIFAGLETPTGINSAGTNDGTEQFVLDAWTDTSFSWQPGAQTPQGILDLGFAATDIRAARGYVSFKQSGSQSVTFQYESGNHRLNLVGVDVCRLDGTVVAQDYHVGFTGSQKHKNVYTLTLPEKGIFLVRYFVEVKTETVHSSGSIAYSAPVTAPVIVRDLPPGSTPRSSAHATPAPAPRRALGTFALSAGSIADGQVLTDRWTPTTWTPLANVPSRINELGHYAPHVYSYAQNLNVGTHGTLTAEFNYASGNNRLDLVGVDLLDAAGNAVAFDYHFGYTGSAKKDNVFRFNVPFAGEFKLRYLVSKRNEALTSSGNIRVRLALSDTLHLAASPTLPIRGVWSRNTHLQQGKTWSVSGVVGLVAPDQARRSFLAYSERERAVPWRAMPAYISWYELNIDRNNDPAYTGNMHDYQCEDVVRQWKKNLYDKWGEHINSFVWDDGWDFYGPWTFNRNFPNGFAETDRLARQMGSGIGAWLGPVGGYGRSGDFRRAYWEQKGKMQLSNPQYYKAFTDAITNLCHGRGYDFRFFKFDGISGQFSSVGPDPGTVGEENAEGIISAERMVRRDIKEDIFFNTTVGTWASPFWFSITDAIWRQEKDYGEISNNGNDRERWITYRDRLVYQNFVQNSPLCPINTLMTHGFILSRFGDVSKSMDYNGIVRELRCAFACGSGMVELYNDYSLMNSINGGRLWGDLAECLRWQRNNADVLPDVHWVGGNPWDGKRANVYGWASWNGRKATLALRNPAGGPATYSTTLRQALEIPAYVSGAIVLTRAFGTQATLVGLAEDTPIDIDTPLTLSLPASSVYVFNGRESSIPAVEVTGVSFTQATTDVVVGQQTTVVWNIAPVDATHTSVTWTSSDPTVATVQNGVVRGMKEGTAVITVTTRNGRSAQITVCVVPFVPEDYAVSFDKTAPPVGTDRFLTSIALTAEGQSPVRLTLRPDRKPYQDLTATPVRIPAGAVVTPQLEWTGSYMHAYAYIDLDGNRQFDAPAADSPELLCFTYYKDKQKSKDGLISFTHQNPGVGTMPKFLAPTRPGQYRMRFKIDWNNIDPAGSTETGNDILKNRGSITDLLIEVYDPTALDAVRPDAQPAVLHDLSGRRLGAAPEQGVYLRNGRKAAR